MKLDLSDIWGTEIKELRKIHVNAVKLKHPPKGYDIMLNRNKYLQLNKG